VSGILDQVEQHGVELAEIAVKDALAAVGVSSPVIAVAWDALVVLVKGAEGLITKDQAKLDSAEMDAADVAADELEKKVLGG